MSPRSNTTSRPQDIAARRQQINQEIAALGPTLPGSLVTRSSRCGNSGCHCRAEPPQLHGPYPAWTRSVGGKTVTRALSPQQAERYRPWFDNTRRLRELVEELKDLALQQAELDEHWPS